MTVVADTTTSLCELDEALRTAVRPSRDLFTRIIAAVCTRVLVLGKSHLERLIDAGAWTDAAFALLELELPLWKVRRLVCENGEWFCSLSRRPNLPVTLDDSADAVHGVLALAVLRAVVEARHMSCAPSGGAGSEFQAAVQRLVCCDNFA